MKNLALLLIGFLCIGFSADAQLMVQQGQSAQQMAEAITGDNVEILNPQITCPTTAWGTFEADVDDFSLSQGILLSTGRITNALGPNNSEAKSTAFFGNNGDPKLDIVSGYATRDACKLEFDIIPAGDSLRFAFSFASEEYNEYACTNFNDVFGFFISGPGIVGDPALSGFQNIALIPGTNVPVTINTVNSGNPNDPNCPPVNSAFHQQNPLSPIADIQYDGWTQGLIAVAGGLIPCETYRLELIVADATDRLWDSGVFIEEIESNNVVVEVTTQGGNAVMYEACNDAVISFCLEAPQNFATNVPYFLQGTAVNGVDYELISSPDPNFQHNIVIPAGQLCAEVPINTIDDGVFEGLETIEVIVINPLCDGFLLDSLRTYIYDSLEVDIMGDLEFCLGESTLLTTDSGGVDFTWSASPTLDFMPSNLSDSVTITPLQTTVVTLNTSIASCTAQDQAVVRVSDMDLQFDITDITCDLVCNGAIDLTILNGIPPYDIQWVGVSTDEDIADLCAGDYEVRVLDAAGCLATEIVTVGQSPPIEVVISPSTFVGGANISCNGAADASIDVVLIGGTAPFDTTYSAGPTNLGPGAVTVTVTDFNGCTGSSTITITEPEPLTGVISDIIASGCTGPQSGGATVTCQGGSGTCVSIIWTDALDAVVGNGAQLTGVDPGTYTATIIDQNGCVTAVDVVIPGTLVDLELNVVSQSPVSCSGSADGTVEVLATGGTPDYTYEWADDLSIDPARTGLEAGTYVVTVTDAIGCIQALSVVITEPSELIVEVVAENDIECEGQSCGNAFAVASGGTAGVPAYTYTWDVIPSGLLPGFPQNGQSVELCEAGFYEVTVVDINGCVDSDTIEITIASPLLEGTFDILSVACAGESTGAIDAQITGGTGAYTFLWTGGNCGLGPFTTEDLDMVCSGEWCLTVTDATGCTLDTCLFIDEPPALNYFFEMEPTLCADNCTGEIDFVPVGGTAPYEYVWSGPVFPIDNSDTAFDGLDTLSTEEDLTALCKGQYQIVLSDSLGCSFTRRITVTAPDDLLIDTVAISDFNGFEVSCPGACDGFIDIEVTGGTVDPFYDYEFTWFEQALPFTQQGDGAPFDDVFDICASEDTVGYEIIVVDDNLCIQNAFFIIEEPDALSFTFAVTDVTCDGFSDGGASAVVAGGVPNYAYVWTNLAGDTISLTPSIANQPVGIYTLTVTDANNCTGAGLVEITAPPAVLLSLDMVPVNGGFGVPCTGDCDGTVFSVVSGGVGPYTYSWSDTDCTGPEIASDPISLSGLCAGTYFLNVTDSQGCEACEDVELTEPDLINADAADVVNVSCDSDSDGSITLNLAGGLAPYTVLWTPAVGVGELAENLSAGNYTADVTDANNCAAQFMFTVDDPGVIDAFAFSPIAPGGSFNLLCNGDSDASLTLNITQSTGTPTVSWTGPAPVGGTDLLNFDGVVSAGTYIYTITDGGSCTLVDSITVTEPAQVTGVFTNTIGISCFGECDGQVSIIPVGGMPNYQIQWDDPAMSTGPITGADLCARPYTATITDANGCIGAPIYNLMQPAVISEVCVVTDVSCTGLDDGAIDCTIGGGTAPYTCQWTGPPGFTSTDPNLTDLAPGEYCLTCVDDNGCVLEETCYTVGEPVPLILTSTVSDFNGFNVSCSGECDAQIILSATGGQGPYTFLPAVLTGLCEGPVTVSVTDANGCTVSEEIVITAAPPLTIDITSPVFDCGTNINCPGNSTGAIFSNVSGGAMPLTFSWIDAAAMDTFEVSAASEIDQLPAGDYALYVEDANGCFAEGSISLTEPTETFSVEIVPSMMPGGTAVSCAEDCDGSVEFIPTNACGAINYTWRLNGEVVPTTELCPGAYTLIAIDAAECIATGDLSIVIEAPDTLISGVQVEPILCFGDSAQVILTPEGGTPDYSITWSDSDIPAGQDTVMVPAGDYNVTFVDFNGCELALDLEIEGSDTIAIDISSPILISPNFNVSGFEAMDGSIEVTVTGGQAPYTYTWTAANFSSVQEDLIGLGPDRYFLDLVDANGCVADVAITLRAPEELTLPNGISPNGDGVNDGLIIRGIEAFPDNSVKVFNRWGDEVYSRNGYTNADQWRGEGKSNEIVPDGTYFVILEVNGGERKLDAYLELRR